MENEECKISIRMRTDTVFLDNKALTIFENFYPEIGKIYFQSSMEGGHKYSGEHPSNPCDWFYCGSPKEVYKFSKAWFESINILYSDGILHSVDAMRRVAELAGLDLVLLDFGVVVHRQLEEGLRDFVHWQKYLDDFDSETMSIINNIEEWPIGVSNVNFSQVKNFK
jgi:hypothetical protein